MTAVTPAGTDAVAAYIATGSAAARALQIRAEQVRSVYRNSPTTTLGSLFAGLLLVATYWNHVSKPVLLGWLAALFLHQTIRVYHYVNFRKATLAEQEQPRWGTLYIIAAITAGCIWGSAGVIMFVPGSIGYQAVLAFILYGIATVSMTALSAYAPAFYWLIPLTLLPFIARMMLEGGVDHVFLSLPGIIVLLVALSFGGNINRLIAESINKRFENLDLIEQLKEQMQAADAARHEAEVANRVKSQFLAAASHDLRQPLHAMGLFAAALSEKIRDPEDLNVVNSINASVHALEALFNELLDISKIDAGAIRPEPRDFPIKPVLDRLRDEFLAEASEKGLQLSLRASDRNIHSDPLLLERILRNLVSNAIRNTLAGEVAVGDREQDGKLLLEVHDSGVGIPAEHLDRIFDEFYQIESPGRSSTRGLGLGLSIVKRLCGLLGHPIRVTSVVGRGSAFSVEIPLSATQLREIPAAPTASGSGGDLAGKLVVVIDDEAAIIGGMQVLLRGWGATVIGSTTGEDVVTAVHAAGKLPDLIIADYQLGAGPDGIAVVQRIRQELDPEIPAILITGTMRSNLMESARDARLEFLLKPVIPDKLRALISLKLQQVAGD